MFDQAHADTLKELERLRAENARLREATNRFARDGHGGCQCALCDGLRAALAGKEGR